MNRQRTFVSMSLTAALMLGLVGGVLSGAKADGKYPHYLNALADLRMARAWITAGGDSNVEGRETDALTAIDKAIAEIKRASIDDGKDPNDHPPIDAHIKHKDRLKKADALLNSARKDLRFDEDDHAALGWRKLAVQHVNEADKADKEAIKDVRHDI